MTKMLKKATIRRFYAPEIPNEVWKTPPEAWRISQTATRALEIALINLPKGWEIIGDERYARVMDEAGHCLMDCTVEAI